MFLNGKTTIAQDIDRVRWLAFYPALSVIVITRRDIGFRLLRPVTLIVSFCLFTLFAANGNNARYRPQDLFWFGVAMLIAGFWQRIARWRGIAKGISHHSHYIGTPWLETGRTPDWMRRYRRTSRFVEPVICSLVGFILFHGSPMLGGWLMFSGFCILVFEDAVYRRNFHRRLDAGDGLIESDIHGGYVDHFSSKSSSNQSLFDISGLQTGVGPDIAGKIKKQTTKK